MTIDTANAWVAIPFNATGPSSNVSGSTSSPASITALTAGIYQLNVSLYFSSELSPEGSFNQTTYTLGISINGGSTVAYAAVYAGEAGYFSLNYNTLVQLSANDSIAFYMEASNVGGGGSIFDNVVTMIRGDANLVQVVQ